jgi:hypothetical protein
VRCNQRFFGQEHFEKGTSEREFCSRLGILKPVMAQYEFALRDSLPQLPTDEGGLLQVKYNGMLSIVIWDDQRGGFVAWSPRGRCFYSLDAPRKYPVTEYFNNRLSEFKDVAFVGETYVVREIEGKCYMTEFNKSMSIIKNPRSTEDVSRIRLAVFDYASKEREEFIRPTGRYFERLNKLQRDFGFPVGCDSGVVHLPDHSTTEENFQESYNEIQRFWDEFIRKRGFEGFVMHTDSGKVYKIKFRGTLDAAVIAFRKAGDRRPVCDKCGAKFDAFWLRKLTREGITLKS